MSATLIWFRQDLRLQDNPALHAALVRGGPVVPIFIWDPDNEERWPPGAASKWWLHHSLKALDASLRERGSRLVIARGDSLEELRGVIKVTGANAVYWNRRYEPHAVARESWLETALPSQGVEVKSFNAALLNEPAALLNRQGRPFQVFSAYWRQSVAQPVPAPLKLAPGPFPAPVAWPGSLALDALELLTRMPLGATLARTWEPGEAGATRRLRRFIADGLADYDERRDEPGRDATSMLSPHLHFGEVGPRQIWAAVKASARGSGVFPPNKGAGAWLRELGWREFAHHLVFHFPQTPVYPLRQDFGRFPWADDPGGKMLAGWQRGLTGYPIVDAGIRQLAQIGWMHNRVRMIVASFLVKHLRLPWTQGAAWFWDTLVDADLANNTLGWQWTAGCGADAAPFFRIFAPVLQGQKFDPKGDYVRRWIPELTRLPAEHVHSPWKAPNHVLAAAGVRLDGNYPRPIVDHATARDAALAAFRQMRLSR
ncbi:MAG: deoxyribodipyrimidine photo-lyase [Opitutaceae bacterium]|nr:deoxyribodipyrimidine photo-lyase [Opitutaceae bacterium]